MISAATMILAAQCLAIDLTVSGGAGPSSSTTSSGSSKDTKAMWLLNAGGNFLNFGAVAFGWEIPVGFGGPSRTSPAPAFRPTTYIETTDFVATPGLRLRIVPASPVTPWVSVGFGVARTEGQLSGQSSSSYHGALSAAGGVDWKLAPFLLVRGEVRDYKYWSGEGAFGGFNVFSGQSQNYLVFLGGVGIRF